MITEKNIKIGLIYMYTSPSGKIYIGQTINEKSRKNGHKKSIDNPKCKTRFKIALKKYGYNNFEYKILIQFKPTLKIEKLKRVLNKLEKRYIEILKSNHPEIGYNLTTGGDSFLHSEESKEKMRQEVLNRSLEWRQKLSNSKKKELEENTEESYLYKNLQKGHSRVRKPLTIEHKQKLSDAKKNKKKVAQYDLEENLLNTFNSIEAAAASIDSTGATQKTKANRISECCNEKRKTIYGSVWKFI